jgi:hypothetical protein
MPTFSLSVALPEGMTERFIERTREPTA